MITVNTTLKGEYTYDIFIGESDAYRVSAFDMESAIDLVANYLESHNATNLYIEHGTLELMASCSQYGTIDAYAKAHNLTRCGTNGIYLEITSIKEAHE